MTDPLTTFIFNLFNDIVSQKKLRSCVCGVVKKATNKEFYLRMRREPLLCKKPLVKKAVIMECYVHLLGQQGYLVFIYY